MRRILRVFLLVMLLTGSAGAGEMPNGSSTPPPPPPQTTGETQTPPAAGQEPTADGEMPNGAADTTTEIVLSLLAALSSLL